MTLLSSSNESPLNFGLSSKLSSTLDSKSNLNNNLLYQLFGGEKSLKRNKRTNRNKRIKINKRSKINLKQKKSRRIRY